MDRSIVYAGAGAQDTDLLFAQRGAMVALGMLAEAVLGRNTAAPRISGLAVTPTTTPSMQVVVGRGAMFGWDALDATAYGALGADIAHNIVHCAINLDQLTLPAVTAPSGAGQIMLYLVQAQAVQQDTGALVLPFWNAADPAHPFLGPGNSGGAVPTQRVRRVVAQIKAGAPAAAGSQVAPVADAGWIPLALISVAAGQTSIAAANIAVPPGNTSLPYTLPNLTPGYVHRVRLAGSGSWTVPNGVVRIRVTRTGGGGGGGDCQANGQNGGSNVAGGGGAGATEIDDLAVQPGQVFSYVVGQGGASQVDGTASQFAGLAAANPGVACPGFAGTTVVYSSGGLGGTASPAGFSGGDGADGQNDPYRGYGDGGASYWGGGGRAGSGGGRAGRAPGSGGGGAYDASATNTYFKGGAGADGLILVEY